VPGLYMVVFISIFTFLERVTCLTCFCCC